MNVEVSPVWPLPRKLLFRYCTVYFVLYLTASLGIINSLWDVLVTWTGKLLINKDYTILVKPNGSGDTTYNYLILVSMTVLTLIICVGWSVSDRKRINYQRLQYWLIVLLRYKLAVTLISYGMYKIIKTQFPFPSLLRLDQTIGDMSPMGLAWTYMGFSSGYNVFTGLAEFTGGFLLFFRRTTLMGALISITVLLNIVAMNLFYDIPVKLFSIHLLVMALLIALPDAKRLIDFFFLNKAVPAVNHWHPAFHTKWKRITFFSLKYLFIALTLYEQTIFPLRYSIQNKNHSPLYGIYEIKQVTGGKSELISTHQGFKSWNKIYLEQNFIMLAKKSGNELDRFHTKVDTIKHMFSYWKSKTDSVHLHYEFPEKDILSLSGIVGTDSIQVQLTRKDPREFLLISRGFHWINERPLNR